MINIKISILGEKSVGKTSLINQYVDGIFSFETMMTLSFEKSRKKININKKEYIIDFYETMNNNIYKYLNYKIIKESNIIILVYDVTNLYSFKKLNYWYKLACQINGKNNTFLSLIGNKNDLNENKEINIEEAIKYSKSINAIFKELNSINYKEIHNFFNQLIYEYINNYEMEIYKGNLIKGKKENYEIMKYKKGNIYSSNFKKDSKKRIGRMEYKNKKKIYFENENLIDGIFINDKLLKSGILNIKNKETFQSDFDENNESIEVKIIYKNGDIYYGKCDINGLKKGIGIMKYKSGIIYDGEWDNDLKNGKGILCLNENDYKLFKSKINFIFSNNIQQIFHLNLKQDVYYGSFLNDKKEGNGIFFQKSVKYKNNENLYIGKFHEDKMNYEGNTYFQNEKYSEIIINSKKFFYDEKLHFKEERIFEQKHNINNKIVNSNLKNNKSIMSLRKKRVNKSFIR